MMVNHATHSARFRAPGPRRQLSQAFALCKVLNNDDRFRELDPTTRYVLLCAAIEWADASGRFYPSKRTWAKAAGVSAATLKRHVRLAEGAGLLARSDYHQPNGRSGANEYQFDTAMVVAAAGLHGEGDATGGEEA
jgi:hypothetical protein